MGRGEGFVVEVNGEDQLDAGAKVLEEPDRGEPQALGSVGKPKQRKGGDDSGAEVEQLEPPTFAKLTGAVPNPVFRLSSQSAGQRARVSGAVRKVRN